MALWLGSKGIVEQTRLCSIFGGLVPRMAMDGSFAGWIAEEPVDEGSMVAALSKYEVLGLRPVGQLREWARRINEGEAPVDFESALESIALEARLGAALGFGEPNSKLSENDKPLVYPDAPVLVGLDSAKALAALREDCKDWDGVERD